MRTPDIESAVVRLLEPRRNLIVPRISYTSWLRHECDLLMITPNHYAYEIELKASAADLRKDFSKRHGHANRLLRGMYYAMPEKVWEVAGNIVPEDCGVIVVNEITRHEGSKFYHARYVRRCRNRRFIQPLSDKQVLECYRNLGLKFWELQNRYNVSKRR